VLSEGGEGGEFAWEVNWVGKGRISRPPNFVGKDIKISTKLFIRTSGEEGREAYLKHPCHARSNQIVVPSEEPSPSHNLIGEI